MIGRLHLRVLIPLIMIITLGILVGVGNFFVAPKIKDNVRQLSMDTMTTTLEGLKADLAPYVALGDREHIDRDLFFASTDRYNRNILVIADDGEVLYSNRPDLVGQNIAVLPFSYDRSIGMTVMENESVELREHDNASAFLLGYAGFKFQDAAGNDRGAALFLVNDYGVYEESLTNFALEPVYLSTFIFIGSMLLLLVLLSTTITNRIGHLMRAAGRLGSGEEGARVNLKGNDEFAKLGQVFDQMAEYVEDSYKTMKEAVEQAEAASHAKSDFLANISHEIRTPLTGVLGMLDAADQADLPPNARRYTRLAQSSAQTLLDLINDILDISQLEAGKKRLNLAPCRIDRLAENVMNALDQSADAKNLEMTLDNNLPEEVWTSGDEKVIRQIMFNLVGNAIKFTSEGSVNITLDGKYLDKGKNRIGFHIVVSDTGIGISKQDAARLFNRFEQVEDFSNSAKGTGLGLAICRELVELMHGKIWIESEEGKGSEFHVTFDLETMEKPQNVFEDMPKNAVPVFVDKLHVLAVDDNPINRMVIEKTVLDLGLDVTLKESGEEALEEVKGALRSGDQKYDIILMDIHMPGMDGIETLSKIRVLGGWANSIPVIALTAHAITGQADEFMRQGMSGYVSKPIDRINLAQEIANLTNAHLGAKQRAGAEETEEAPKSNKAARNTSAQGTVSPTGKVETTQAKPKKATPKKKKATNGESAGDDADNSLQDLIDSI